MEDSSEKLSTRAVGIRYGLILAAVSVLFFLLAAMLSLDTTQGPGRWVSLIFMVVVFVLGHKYYKDNGDGYMSYGQGMGIGFWASLISSLISSTFTYLYVKFIDTNWMETLKEMQLEEMERQGMSEEQMEMAMEMMGRFSTPEMIFVFSILGGILLGVIASLVITIFTQRNNDSAPF